MKQVLSRCLRLLMDPVERTPTLSTLARYGMRMGPTEYGTSWSRWVHRTRRCLSFVAGTNGRAVPFASSPPS